MSCKRGILILIVMFSTLEIEAKSCMEVFKMSWHHEQLTRFFSKLQAGSVLPMAIRSFIFEISNGTTNYIMLLPGLSVRVEAYSMEGYRVISVKSIENKTKTIQAYEASMELLTYALLKSAQRFWHRNPQVKEVRVFLPKSDNPDVVQRQRALGFNFDGNGALYFRMGPQDPTPPRAFMLTTGE